jgi:hypothetical protein
MQVTSSKCEQQKENRFRGHRDGNGPPGPHAGANWILIAALMSLSLSSLGLGHA